MLTWKVGEGGASPRTIKKKNGDAHKRCCPKSKVYKMSQYVS